jgi:sugar phosphate permease
VSSNSADVVKGNGVNFKGWLVCLTSALFFFYIFIQMSFFPAIEPYLLQKYQIGTTGVATLSSMYFYGNIVFLFPAGLILDRVSTKKVLLFVMGVSVISTLLFGWSTFFYQAELTRFVMGIAGSFCLLASVRLASRWFPAEKMALVVGAIVTLAMIGGMVAQSPFQMLSDLEGFQKTVYVDVGIGGFIWLLILLVVRDNPDTMGAEDAAQAHGSPDSLLNSIYQVLKVKQNWLAGLYASLVNLPVFLIGGFSGIMYLVQVHGLGRTQASLVNSMLFLGMIFGSPLYGLVSDQLRSRKRPMIVGALLSILLLLVIMYLPTNSVVVLSALFFIFGFAIMSQVISYPLVAESNSMSLTGTAEGLASILIMSGGLTSSIFAWMLNYHGHAKMVNDVPVYSAASYHFAFGLMLGAFVLALLISFGVKETHCKRLVED